MKAKVNLIDRILLSFVSGVTAFVTGTVVWWIFTVSFVRVTGGEMIFPANTIIIFAGVMALLGLFTATNVIITVLTKLWSGLYHLSRSWFI